ncbi:Transcriptional regulator PadR-like family protein [Halopenitus malekzadehii]|uniref:Transcriptional regulator PadR-like family protein n=1 Tax=Halopenitus malekzadehii TaxID=1267564 RepID=A0A1H6JFU8_9EURY|nr:helix-turn-helix transcriptional regulator [Halopenitus malekzadehii]SEH60774.1 Transcriptional regulator PadR-like family protein [Halopenitus malekzadehii]
MSTSSMENVEEYVDLSGFQRDILWTIFHADDAVHGLAIKEALEENGYQTVHHGRLYSNLDDLVDAGLVEKGTRDGRTNEYTLTDTATTVLADRQSWERGEI